MKLQTIETSSIAKLPTKYGEFNIQAFKEGEKEHLAILTKTIPSIPLVRIHSECLTGDALGSKKCDCGEQLEIALGMIQKEGGIILYLRQEGRNIGLLNKVNAYHLQDLGYDTVEANHQLGFGDDEREYGIVEFMLKHYGVKQIRLLTNNPKKIESLHKIEIVERVPIIVHPNPYNENYLHVKGQKMGHLLEES